MSRSEQVGFLQMMRWMLDSNFAGINTNAQKVHREVRGRTVRRAPHGSGRQSLPAAGGSSQARGPLLQSLAES